MRYLILSLFFVSSFASANINLTFTDVTVKDFSKHLSTYSEKNILFSSNVDANLKFDIHLTNTNFDKAFNAFLNVTNLDFIDYQDYYLVINLKEELPFFSPAIFELQYIDAETVLTVFTPPPNNFLFSFPSTNYLIAYLDDELLEDLKYLLKKLDVPTSQVMLEASILEVSSDYVKNMGVKFGLISESFKFNSSLPSSSFTSFSTSSLEAIISDIESTGAGKIISKPKLFSSHNSLAEITQGFELPYFVPQGDGLNALDFKQANFKLGFTPRVMKDYILIDFNYSKDTPDFSANASAPSILTSSLSSTFRLVEGETLALGGLTVESSSKSSSRSLLSYIPLLGRLFVSDSDKRSSSELLIFVNVYVFE